MKIIAFNGSPRAKGNCYQLIEEVFSRIQTHGIETEIVQIGGHALRGCSSCYSCFKTKDGICAIKSDRMNEFIAKANQADAILLASPTYYGSMSAEMKAFVDRLGLTTISAGRTLTRKVGAAVVSVRRAGAVPVYDSLNRFLLGSGMVVPGSTYWNMAIGEEPGDVTSDQEGMHNIRDLGEQLAWLMKLTASAKDSELKIEKTSFSNYYK